MRAISLSTADELNTFANFITDEAVKHCDDGVVYLAPGECLGLANALRELAALKAATAASLEQRQSA